MGSRMSDQNHMPAQRGARGASWPMGALSACEGLSCVPSDWYVEVLTPRTSARDCAGEMVSLEG